MASVTPPLALDTSGLAVLFATSGSIHLVRPQLFEPIVPAAPPMRRRLVYASGIAEIVCAACLIDPRTRRLAGITSAGLLVALFPANVKMSVDLGRRAWRRRNLRSAVVFAGSLTRLPAQWTMIRAALRAAGA